MRIGVDIDGVLGDQVPPILKRVNVKYGTDVAKSDIRLWDQPIADTDIKTEIEEALRDSLYVATMPLMVGAREALAKLCKSHHIVVATSRPIEASQATERWLRENRLCYHEFVNSRDIAKSSLAIEVLIDDNLDNIREFALQGRLAILFSQPWNQQRSDISKLIAAGRILCANNWSHVLRLIDSLSKAESK